jgi:hypothetical protein
MSDSDSDAPVDGEEEEDLECAGPLLPAGVRKRRHAIHNYFTYNKKSKKSKCKTGDCGVELSGKNTTNLINHLKKPSHKKDYAIYLQDVALSDKQQTSSKKAKKQNCSNNVKHKRVTLKYEGPTNDNIAIC